MKKRTTAAYVLTAALFLSGCANDGVADAMESIQTIDSIEQTLVSELNTVTSKEKGLQESFESALAEGKKNTSFTDGKSAIYKNIEERKNSVKTIKESTDELKTTQKTMNENDGEKVPNKEIDPLIDSMKELRASLDDYTKQYDKSLAEEEKYFKSLGTEKATYETLTDGMKVVNELDTSNKEQLKKINEQFKQLNEYQKEAEKTLEALTDSTK